MKHRLKNILGKVIAKLKLIHEGYKLAVIFNNPNISIAGGLIIESYFSASLPAGNYSVKFGPGVHFKKYSAL